MARNRKGKSDTAAHAFIELIAMLPWWVGITIAAVSYFVLHAYAKPEPALAVAPGQIGGAMAHTLFKAIAAVAQYIIPLFCAAGAAISAWKKWRRFKLIHNVTHSKAATALESMTWQEFEILVGESFRQQGFRVAEIGGGGPDGGVDLVLHKGSEMFLVQCKQWKAMKVGVDVVRQLYGVMAAKGAAGGFVVTSGRFTPDALGFARGRNIDLIDGDKLLTRIRAARSAPAPDPTPRPEPRAASAAPLQVVQSTSPPPCPLCDSAMTLREARRGANAGKSFWGCTNYPSCKGTKTA